MSRELHRLNAYPEWHSRESLDQVIEFVDTIDAEPPPELEGPQRRRFIQKFRRPYWVVEDDALFYRPNADLNLLVVPQDEAEEVLEAAYQRADVARGAGIHSFYSQISSLVLGITRAQTSAWLKRQADYQLGHPSRTVVNRPILAARPNERWSVDLMDMSTFGHPELNNGHRYILVCVDVFSRFVFARAVRGKTDGVIRDALGAIMREARTVPRLIQTDNGGEWGGRLLRRLLESLGCRHVRTRSYTPQSNGLVERFNQTLLGRLKAGFIQTGTLAWADNLESAVLAINSTRAAATKTAPNRLWKAGYNRDDPIGPAPELPLDHDPTNAELAALAAGNSAASAARMIAADDARRFNIGDRVRVSMAVLSSDYRKKVKEGRAKQLIVHWSTDVFRVRRVLESTATRRERYGLVGVRGTFYGQQLLGAADEGMPTTIRTAQQAADINRTR